MLDWAVLGGGERENEDAELPTPNPELRTPNSERQTSNSEPQVPLDPGVRYNRLHEVS